MNEHTITPVYASSIDGKVTVEELRRKEEEFPFCSVIQFHLLQALKETDPEQYVLQAQKASVYFPDVYKLNWHLFLASGKPTVSEKSSPESFAPLELVEDEHVEKESLLFMPPVANEEEIINDHTDLNIEPEDEVIESELPANEMQLENVEAARENDGLKNEGKPGDEAIALSDAEMAHTLALEMIANASKQQDVPPEEAIVYEPLYTKDYFASQGIKLSEETLTKDKLGKQMKSFTEWLKTMKKINPDKQPEPDDVVDKQIQFIAEKSNKTDDVVTEAMADVLLLQGKHQKAIEMYEKLSLINPAKSAYFAAIIQVIKKV